MSKFELRDYQKEAVDASEKHIKSGDSTPGIVVGATGSGKSLMIGALASRIDNPIVVLQPSTEILEQNLAKYKYYGGEATIYSASLDKKEMSKVTFCTLGSVKNLGGEFAKQGGEIVLLVDECHFGYKTSDKTSMFMKFVKDLKPKSIIGFTATPFRLNQYGDLTDNYSQLDMLPREGYFKKFIYVGQIQTLVDRKYWADIDYEEHDFDPSKLQFNSTGAEFKDKSVKQALKEQNVHNRIYKRVLKVIQDNKSALVFLESVAVAETFQKNLKDKCRLVTGTTPKKERKQIVKDFKNGKFPILLNYGTFVVGFDHPELDIVIMGRPTNSLAVFYQIAGRVVRNPSYPKQKKALVIDFCGNVKRFGKLEDLRIQQLEDSTWCVTSKDRILTGVPMTARMTIEEYKKMNAIGEDAIKEYKMPFGIHKGKTFLEIPIGYREWLLDNFKNFKFKGAPAENVRTLLIASFNINQTVKDNPNRQILIDYKNTAYSLYAKRKLSEQGLNNFINGLKIKFKTNKVKIYDDGVRKKYWRRKIDPEYKENRSKSKADPKFLEALFSLRDVMGDKIISKEDTEADDWISNEVRDFEGESIVVSKDGDFKQLGFFKKFKQYNCSNNSWIETSPRYAIETLVTKVLKGDRKDNVMKCHYHRAIMSKDLNNCLDLIVKDIVHEVKDNGIVKIEDLNLRWIIFRRLIEFFDINDKKFERNFTLINLIQNEREGKHKIFKKVKI